MAIHLSQSACMVIGQAFKSESSFTGKVHYNVLKDGNMKSCGYCANQSVVQHASNLIIKTTADYYITANTFYADKKKLTRSLPFITLCWI